MVPFDGFDIFPVAGIIILVEKPFSLDMCMPDKSRRGCGAIALGQPM